MIESKANIGESVFFVKQIKMQTCPVCGGSGKIYLGSTIEINLESLTTFVDSISEQLMKNIDEAATGNVKEYDCPECKGKGAIRINGSQPRYEVGTGVVIAIEAAAKQNGIRMIYRINDHGINRTLTDDKLWLSQDEANKQCVFLNLERREIPISSVHIPSCFATTIPCNEKLMRRLDEWRSDMKFKTEIYVDEDLNLFDGYTSFLVYRMLGISNIPVVIWPKSERSK